ncbi:MAG: hypothetical protein DCC71_08900 [Proteobacteria bacterium]|nr:MAG: hypothetical protein DCC71_08900 [Pseudomonadota bacterium]
MLALAAAALPFGARADQGAGVIESKEPGKVVIGGATFRLSDATVLEDDEGRPITYAELPTLASGASADAAAAWYEAGDGQAEPLLHRLQLTGGMPD